MHPSPLLVGVLLVLCGFSVSASYNGTCARELVWAPTQASETTLEVGWRDSVPAVLVLVNATSNHYVRVTGRYNKDKAAPGPVTQETHRCISPGTNETLLVPNADASARIRLDPATNDTLLEPLPGRDVVFANDVASIAVLEWLANMTRSLVRAEDRVFGPGAAPAVTSEPPPAVSTGHPGTWGTDDQGRLVIEPLAGRTVLVAGVDVFLELHYITERTKNLKAAMAACPCLAQPATCHPCGARRCTGTPRCNCTAGWRGTICDENLNECMLETHNCDTLRATCKDTDGSFTCACNTGFIGSGVVCNPLDECASGAHNCNRARASCTDTAGSFTCACNKGYTGSGISCADVSECALNIHNCDPSAACADTLGSFTCACNAGYTGSGVACINVNECTTRAHNCIFSASCTDTTGSFTCTCSDGYAGNGVSTCSDVNECTLSTHNCNFNAACTNTVGSFTCACNAGYTGGGTTCVNVNQCIGSAHNCNANALCTTTPGSFACTCNNGYTGNGISSCANVNECANNAHNCNVNGLCTDTAGSFTCACNAAYTGNGVTCANVNECAINMHNCNANAACSDTAGSFTCACRLGFTGDGTACNNMNECTVPAHSCHVEAACTDTVGSFICACRVGFAGDGTACANVNECTASSHNCHASAVCTDSVGSFTCACSSGFTGSGTVCTNVNECTARSHSCHVDATCTDTTGSFTCACNAGFEGNGTACSINECAASSDNCHANAMCTDTVSSFTCACNRGFSGSGTACADVNECAAGTHNCNVNARCTNTAGSFTCACNTGYTGNGISTSGCADIDECTARTHTCHLNATCGNLAGSFNCSCNIGFFFMGPTSCAACNASNNFFSTTVNRTNCVFGAICPSGRFVSQALTFTSNRVCADCGPGLFSNMTNMPACLPWSTCSAGFYVDPGAPPNASTDRVCLPCPGETFQPNQRTTVTACTPQPVCTIGLEEVLPSTPSTARTCRDIDECNNNLHNCLSTSAACLNTASSFICTCNSGFIGDGISTCTNVNECILGTHSCNKYIASCADTIGSFTCECNAGITNCEPYKPVDFSRFVSITTTGLGLPFTAVQQTSDNVYTRGFQLFLQSFAGSSGNVVASVGTLSGSSPFTTSLAPAASVLGILLDSVASVDNPVVRVALQARDAQFNTRMLLSTQLRATIMLGAQTLGSSTCTPNALSGNCTVSISLAAAIGALVSGNANVLIGIGATAAQRVGTVTLQQRELPVYTDNFVAIMPSVPLFLSQSFSVQIVYKAPLAINSVLMQVVVLDPATATLNALAPTVPSEWDSPVAEYTRTTSIMSGSISLIRKSGSNPATVNGQGNQVEQQLVTASLTVAAGTNIRNVSVQVFVKNAFLQGNAPFRPDGQDIPVGTGLATLVVTQAPVPSRIGVLPVSADPLLGIFAHNSRGQGVFLNTRPIVASAQQFTSMFLTGYYGNTQSGRTQRVISTSSGVSCTVTPATGVVSFTGCSSMFFDGSSTQGHEQVNVIFNVSGVSTIMPLRVWALVMPLSVAVSTNTLRPVAVTESGPYFLGAGGNCNVPFFTEATVRAETYFTAGALTSAVVDVTQLVLGQLASSNTSAVAVVPNTNRVTGVGAGSATVAFGTLSQSVNVTVATDRVAQVLDLNIRPYASITVQPLPNIPADPFAPQTATVQLVTGPLIREDQRNQLVVTAVLFDPVSGQQSLMSLTNSSGLRVASLNPSILAIESNGTVFNIRSLQTSGNATVNARWAPACASSAAFNGTQNVTVRLPPAQSASIVNSASQLLTTVFLAVDGSPAQRAGYASSQPFNVLLNYIDPETSLPYSRNLTADPRMTLTPNSSIFEVVGGSTILARAPGTGTLRVSFGHESVTATVTIVVVAAVDLVLTATPFPTYSGSGSVSRTTLAPIGETGVFTNTSVRVSMTFTNGQAPQDVTALAVVTANVNTRLFVTFDTVNWIVSVRDSGATSTTQLSATVGSLGSSAPLAITVSLTKLTILSFTSFRITGTGVSNQGADFTLGAQRNSIFNIQFGITLSDNSQLTQTNLFVNSLLRLQSLVNFSSSDPSAASINADTGVITLQQNWFRAVVITVRARDAGAVQASVNVFCNLAMTGFDVDLGSTTGAPVPRVLPNAQFSVPVLFNAPSPVAGLSLRVAFNTSMLTLVSAVKGSDWQGAFAPNPDSSGGIVSFGGSDAGRQGSNQRFAVLTFRAGSTQGVTMLSATIAEMVSPFPIVSLVPEGSLAVAGALVPVQISSTRRRREAEEDGMSMADVQPSLPAVRSRRACCVGSCGPFTCTPLVGPDFPPGDVDLSCSLGVADQVLAQTWITAESQGFTSASGPAMRNLTPKQLDLMDVNQNNIRQLDDVTLSNNLFFNRYRYVSRPTLVPVASPDSQCQVEVRVTVLQSPDTANYCSDLSGAASTVAYIGLASNLSSQQAAFDASGWPPTPVKRSFGSGGLFGGFVRLSNTGQGGVWRVRAETELSSAAIGGVVAQFILTGGAPSQDLSTLNLGYPSGPYMFNRLLNESFPAGSGTQRLVASGAQFNPMSLMSNLLTSSTCKVIRAPSNLTASAVSGYWIQLAWQPPADLPYPVSRYIVYFRVNPNVVQPHALPISGATEFSADKSFNVSGLTFNVTDLQPYIAYQFRVLAWNPQASGFNASLNASTAEAVPTATPQALSATPLSPNSVSVLWEPLPATQVNGILQGYRLSYTRVDALNQNRSDPAGMSTRFVQVSAATGAFVFDQLEEHITYSFSVAAFTVAGDGPAAVVQATTLEVSPDGRPVVLSVLPPPLPADGSTSLVVSFQELDRELHNGQLDGYTVFYSRSSVTDRDGNLVNQVLASAFGANPELNVTVPAPVFRPDTVLQATLSGLQSAVNYGVAVVAFNVIDGVRYESNRSLVVFNMTLEAAPAGPPATVSLASSGSASVNCSWTLPLPQDQNGLITGFQVRLQRPAGQESAEGSFPYPDCPLTENGNTCVYDVPRSSMAADAFSFNMGGLESFVTYSATVAARTAVGFGPASTLPATALTAQTTPDGGVQELQAVPASATSMQLTWTTPLPAKRNGVIQGYVVSYARASGENFFAAPTDPGPQTVTLTTLETPGISGTASSTYVISGLEEFVRYTFSVSPFTLSAGQPGPVQAVTNRTLQAVPAGPPRQLQASNVMVDTELQAVDLIWEGPEPYLRNGIILGYRVFYSTSDARALPANLNVINVQTVTDANSTRVLGLQPFLTYSFSVVPFTVVGFAADPGSLATLQGLGVAASTSIQVNGFIPTGAPQALSVQTVASDKFTISFQEPRLALQNDLLVGFVVYYIRTSGNLYADPDAVGEGITQNASIIVPIAAGVATYSAEATGLEAAVSYQVWVVAVNRKGQSRVAATLTLQTSTSAPDGAPQNVQQGSLGSSELSRQTELVVTWSAPVPWRRNGPIQQYRVTFTGGRMQYVDYYGSLALRGIDVTRTVLVTATASPTQTTTLTGLEAYTNYVVTIVAATADAARNLQYSTVASAAVTLRTQPGAPMPPPNPVPGPTRSGAAFNLSWPVLSNEWGPIVKLQVLVEPPSAILEQNGMRVSVRKWNSTVEDGLCADDVSNGYDFSNPSGGNSCGGPCEVICPPNTQLSLPASVTTYESRSRWEIAAGKNVTIFFPYITYERVFTGSEQTTAGSFLVGAGDRTGPNGEFLNGPLQAGATHQFRLIVYTADNLFAISHASFSATASASSGGGGAGAAAAGAGIVIALVAVLVIVVVYRRRRGLSNNPKDLFRRGPAATSVTHNRTAMPSNKPGMDYEFTTVPKPSGMPPMAPSNRAAYGGNSGGGGGGVSLSSAAAPVAVAVPMAMSSSSSSDEPTPARPAKGGKQKPKEAIGSDRGLKIPEPPVLPPVQTHEVRVEDLPAVIQQMSANSDFAFSEEYECLETGNEFSREASQLYENKLKNRYANILAYDYTRVRLPLLPGDPYSDYINASFVDGYRRPAAYVAAQGPTPVTVIDFWRMIWEVRSSCIVMVTNLEEKGRVKCHRYWPTNFREEMALMEDFVVVLTHEEDFPDFVVRTLKVQKGAVSRIVKQYHYTSWPDHGVPESTAGTLTVLKKARAGRDADSGPMVVHCSAGVGRTGTLLAVDYCLDQAMESGTVDVFGCLNMMRRQRNTMVQTEEQYIFIYKTLADACSASMTELDPAALRKYVAGLRLPNTDGTTPLDVEFTRLKNTPAPTTARTDHAQLMANKPKNRFQNVLPYESTRVRLVPLPGVTGSDYINASLIDGYKQRGAYIATQGPMEAYLADFWRMVWERESLVVVMLTQLSENGRSKAEQYWPDRDDPPMIVGDYQIRSEDERTHTGFVERTLQLTDLVSETTREIKHFQYLDWASGSNPSSCRPMLRMIEAIDAYQDSKVVVPEESIYGNAAIIAQQAKLRQLKPIVIHCSAGVGRTGAMCALMLCIKRLDEESKVDLFAVTKHLRTQRMSMIQTPEQYEFVYRCLVEYLDKNAEETLYQNVAQARRPVSRAPPAAPAPVPPVPAKRTSSLPVEAHMPMPGMPAYDEPQFNEVKPVVNLGHLQDSTLDEALYDDEDDDAHGSAQKSDYGFSQT